MTVARHELRAGPVHLDLVNGELRYLYIGNREIVRRIYFSVRFQEKWDTAPNEITRCELKVDADTFLVHLDALVQIGPVDYRWAARISGDTDGTITYAVCGAALNTCTQIRRCGIQLLLGAEAVVGQPFIMTRPDGSSRAGVLPRLLDPEVLPMQFKRLNYITREGGEVTAEFAGTTFGYEDQRNFNDSSIKFFSANAHSYPVLEPEVAAESSVTLRLGNFPREIPPPPLLGARLGPVVASATLPHLGEAAAGSPNSLFYPLNKNRPAPNSRGYCTWAFTPAVNLYDDDTFLEDTSAVLDQLRTAHSWSDSDATALTCRLDPVHFESLHPRPARDPRNHTAFAAAWMACLVKYAALGRAQEIAFRLGPGPVDNLRTFLTAHVAQPVREIIVTAGGRSPIVAFGIGTDDLSTKLVFANTTASAVSLPIWDLPLRSYKVHRLGDAMTWSADETVFPRPDGTLAVTFAPFEVAVLSPNLSI